MDGTGSQNALDAQRRWDRRRQNLVDSRRLRRRRPLDLTVDLDAERKLRPPQRLQMVRTDEAVLVDREARPEQLRLDRLGSGRQDVQVVVAAALRRVQPRHLGALEEEQRPLAALAKTLDEHRCRQTDEAGGTSLLPKQRIHR